MTYAQAVNTCRSSEVGGHLALFYLDTDVWTATVYGGKLTFQVFEYKRDNIYMSDFNVKL